MSNLQQQYVDYLKQLRDFHQSECTNWIKEHGKARVRRKSIVLTHSVQFLVSNVSNDVIKDLVTMRQDHCQLMCEYHAKKVVELDIELTAAEENLQFVPKNNLVKSLDGSLQ